MSASGPTPLSATIGHNRSTLLAQLVRFGGKIASVTLLARLVAPSEHGLFAMASGVTFILVLFRDLGLGTAAVQAGSLSAEQCRTLWLAHVLLGAALMLVTLALAWPAAWFFQQPAVAPLLAAIGVSFLVIGWGGFARSQLLRQARFDALARIDAAAALLATGVMIAVGAAGGGAFSFVAFLLVSETVTTVLVNRRCPRPPGRAAFASLRPLLTAGSQITGYHVVSQLAAQLDTFAIGRCLGPHVLGLYNRPFQLLALGHQFVVSPLSQVALATLSRLAASAPAFRAQVRHAVRIAAHLSLPLATCAFVLPREVVALVLGPQWPEAAPLLRWLAVGAVPQSLLIIGFAVAVAAGRARRLMASALVALPVTLLAIALGLAGGAPGVALALAIANVALVLPRLAWITAGSPVGVADFAAALTGPLVANLALGLGLAAGRWLGRDLPPAGGCAAAAIAGAAAYALSFLCWRPLRAEARELLAHLPLAGRSP